MGVPASARGPFASDITRVELTELDVRGSVLQAVLDATSESVWLFGIDGVIVMANQTALRRVGMPAAEVIGRCFTELVPPDLALGRLARLREVAVSAMPLEFEDQRAGIDFLHRFFPVFGPDGRVTHVAAFSQDITARKRSEAARRATEARLELLSRTAARLLASEDPQVVVEELCREVMEHLGCQVFFNFLLDPAAGRLRLNAFAGISAEAGRALEWLDCDGSICGAVSASGERIVVEDVQRSTDARTALVRSYGVRAYCCHPLRGQGRVLGTLSFGTRERERFEETELELMRVVADQVATAMQRLADRRELTTANARLLETDRRKNEFLAMLSHELRNPLAPISNSLHILARAAPGGSVAERAREILERQIGHLSHLVSDLLDVTRVSRNKIRLHRQRLELGEVIGRATEDQRSLFEQSGVHLELSLPSEPLVVDADKTRVAQIVGNLLQNAAKFTPRGGRAELSLAADPAGGHAVLRVRDDGEGMSPETLACLFEPFTQAERTLERSRGGLGLGLALVKSLVELHDGEVSAASDGPGRGSVFTVRLPLAPASVVDRVVRDAPGPRRGRRVVIIEDNADAAESLSDVLTLSGHEVAVARDGQGGLRKVQELRPEVVLCDLGLPGLDGFAVARTLRAEPSTAGVYLVALSGYAQPQDQQKAIDAGFDRHLAKPPRLDELEELLAQLPG